MNERPNILFLLSDQQRWDTCGCYGQSLDTTPNLDLMAREGMRFEHVFTPQPVCGPARACLQTGKYATETGCVTNDIALPAGEKTIAHFLSDAGYRVGYVGKWHLASDHSYRFRLVLKNTERHDFRAGPVPFDRRGGYGDSWVASDILEATSRGYGGHMFKADGSKHEFPADRHRSDVLTDCALEFMASDRGPFFLFVSYVEPHFQNSSGRCEPPRDLRGKFADFNVPGDLVGTKGDWRTEFSAYLGCVGGLDRNLGRIRSRLEDLGMLDDTLVVYTSDHGCHFRTRNAEYKRSCHDASIRVPMVLRGPGFRGGGVVGDLVSLIDLPPTVLAAAGVGLPGSMRGRDLRPLVNGSAVDWPEEVFVQISEDHCGRAVRTRRWKYSVRASGVVPWSGSAARYKEDFLYDLAVDPHERNNLVSSENHLVVREMLARILKRRMAGVGEAMPMIVARERS